MTEACTRGLCSLCFGFSAVSSPALFLFGAYWSTAVEKVREALSKSSIRKVVTQIALNLLVVIGCNSAGSEQACSHFFTEFVRARCAAVCKACRSVGTARAQDRKTKREQRKVHAYWHHTGSLCLARQPGTQDTIVLAICLIKFRLLMQGVDDL